MVNLKKAVPSASNTGNGVAASVLPISYLQAGNSQIPVLIEDMREMSPKVIVSEGVMRKLVGSLRESSMSDIRVDMRARIAKCNDMAEYMDLLISEVEYYTSIHLIQAYMHESKPEK